MQPVCLFAMPVGSSLLCRCFLGIFSINYLTEKYRVYRWGEHVLNMSVGSACACVCDHLRNIQPTYVTATGQTISSTVYLLNILPPHQPVQTCTNVIRPYTHTHTGRDTIQYTLTYLYVYLKSTYYLCKYISYICIDTVNTVMLGSCSSYSSIMN